MKFPMGFIGKNPGKNEIPISNSSVELQRPLRAGRRRLGWDFPHLRAFFWIFWDERCQEFCPVCHTHHPGARCCSGNPRNSAGPRLHLQPPGTSGSPWGEFWGVLGWMIPVQLRIFPMIPKHLGSSHFPGGSWNSQLTVPAFHVPLLLGTRVPCGRQLLCCFFTLFSLFSPNSGGSCAAGGIPNTSDCRKQGGKQGNVGA